MLIPPTKFEAADGIAVYPKEPRLDDIKTDRGEFVEGRRVVSATYLIRKDGDYTLPPIEIEWWNLDRRKVETATLPAIHFNAAPNPAANTAIPPEPELVVQTAAPKPNRFKHYVRLAEIVVVASVASAFILCSGFASEHGWWGVGKNRAGYTEIRKQRSSPG